jgi:YD repeat-containing protein
LTYLADGLVKATTQASGTAEARTTEYEYDGLARTRVVKRQRGNAAEGAPVYDIRTTKYD